MAESYTKQLLLKVTEQQQTAVRVAAEALDVSQQEYMRQRIFGDTRPDRSPTFGEIRALQAQLTSLSVQLSQPVTPTGRRLPVSQLYEYAVILQEKRDKDGEETEPAQIVVAPTTVLASDEGQAQLLAARAIPEEHTQDGKLARLQVVVRPF